MNKLVKEIMKLEESYLKLKCETTGKKFEENKGLLSKEEDLSKQNEEELINYRDNLQLAIKSRERYFEKKERV